MTVFVMKWDLAYPRLRVSDNTVRGRSVFLYGQSPTLQEKKGHICFRPQPAASVISFLVHSSKLVNKHNAVAEDICFRWQKIDKKLT